MSIDTVFLLITIGIIGGAWNAIAGGATLFTFPALMAAGLPPVVANATNYLAMLPSNAAALPAYRKELAGIGMASILPIIIVSGIGAITGSILLLISKQATFEVLIPFLILVATILFALGDVIRKLLLQFMSGNSTGALLYFMLFMFSIYGGYFGAGLGIILLSIVQIMGFTSFHVANSLKNLLATSFTILSIVIFGIGGIIAWPEAIVMMFGSSAGGYLGGHYAHYVNQKYLRWLVIAFGFILTAVYFARTFYL